MVFPKFQYKSKNNKFSGSIRGDFSIEVGRNICHGSDAVESANKEIALWFKPEDSSPGTRVRRLDLRVKKIRGHFS